MTPVYLAIDRPRHPDTLPSAVVGLFFELSQIPRLELSSSPLPLIIQCMAGDIPDLERITEIIEEIDVDASSTPEQLVKAVVAEIEREQWRILAHVHIFCGIIRSDFVNKCIAVDFPELDILETEDQSLVYHTFRTFTSAFIYVLAGGNENLQKWGLNRYMGTESAGAARTVSTPRLGMSSTPLSNLISTVTSKAKSFRKKGKERARGDDVSALAQPELISTAGSSIPTKTKNQPASLSSAKEPSAAWKKDFTPVHIVPPDYIAEATDKSLLFIRSQADSQPIYTHQQDEVKRLNGPYAFHRHNDLPPYAIYYLRTHGWDDHMVEVVTIAYTCQATLRGFLTAMSRENMSLCEASFLWQTLQHMCVSQS